MGYVVVDVLGGEEFLEGEGDGDEDCDGDEEGEDAGGGAEAADARFEELEMGCLAVCYTRVCGRMEGIIDGQESCVSCVEVSWQRTASCSWALRSPSKSTRLRRLYSLDESMDVSMCNGRGDDCADDACDAVSGDDNKCCCCCWSTANGCDA